MRIPSLAWILPVLAIGCLTLASAAQAEPGGAEDDINPDRPGIADGSTVVGPGRFQIETAVQGEYHSDDPGHDRRLFVPTLLRLGLDDHWELRVEGNTYTRKKSYDPGQGTTDTDGAAPTSLGVKYHFIDSAGVERPSVALIARIFPPSGSGDFRTRHTTGDVRLAADWDFAPKWSLNPNIGVAQYEDDAGRAYTAGLFAATLNYNPSKALNFFVDTGVQGPEKRNGRTSVIFDIGTAYIIKHNDQLDLSAGTGAAGQTSPRPFIAVGISKRF